MCNGHIVWIVNIKRGKVSSSGAFFLVSVLAYLDKNHTIMCIVGGNCSAKYCFTGMDN